ncbi:MAG: hypothetical protein R2717_09225 [Schumannella sp.]
MRVRVPLIPVVAAGVLAAGAAVAAWRLSRVETEVAPASPGTPRLDARLPVALWPPRGDEPGVERGPRGWAVMLAHLAHADTTPDVAERARAVAFASHSRRELDARRTVALEAHVLRGSYDPDLVAAAWLYPLRSTSAAAYRDLRGFGIPDAALDIVRASHDLGLDDARVGAARRRLGVNPLTPDFGDDAFADLDAGDRAALSALVVDAAAARVAARVPR